MSDIPFLLHEGGYHLISHLYNSKNEPAALTPKERRAIAAMSNWANARNAEIKRHGSLFVFATPGSTLVKPWR